MALRPKTCAHLVAIETVKTSEKYICEECVKTGDSWVHLRVCQGCGQTLCCDSSPNQHASRHYEKAGHKVIASAEPGERWLYCFDHHSFQSY